MVEGKDNNEQKPDSFADIPEHLRHLITSSERRQAFDVRNLTLAENSLIGSSFQIRGQAADVSTLYGQAHTGDPEAELKLLTPVEELNAPEGTNIQELRERIHKARERERVNPTTEPAFLPIFEFEPQDELIRMGYRPSIEWATYYKETGKIDPWVKLKIVKEGSHKPVKKFSLFDKLIVDKLSASEVRFEDDPKFQAQGYRMLWFNVPKP